MKPSNRSPFDDCRVIEFDDGERILERNLTESNGILKIHSVLPGETLQSIAYKYYGDSGFWDRIADRNIIFNPLEELTPYTEIIIPKL